VRELVATLARGLVRDPRRVRVREHDEGERAVVELTVAPDDRGRVIGKAGRTASALRTVLDAVARRNGRTYVLDILD